MGQRGSRGLQVTDRTRGRREAAARQGRWVFPEGTFGQGAAGQLRLQASVTLLPSRASEHLPTARQQPLVPAAWPGAAGRTLALPLRWPGLLGADLAVAVRGVETRASLREAAVPPGAQHNVLASSPECSANSEPR